MEKLKKHTSINRLFAKKILTNRAVIALTTFNLIFSIILFSILISFGGNGLIWLDKTFDKSVANRQGYINTNRSNAELILSDLAEENRPNYIYTSTQYVSYTHQFDNYYVSVGGYLTDMFAKEEKVELVGRLPLYPNEILINNSYIINTNLLEDAIGEKISLNTATSQTEFTIVGVFFSNEFIYNYDFYLKSSSMNGDHITARWVVEDFKELNKISELVTSDNNKFISLYFNLIYTYSLAMVLFAVAMLVAAVIIISFSMTITHFCRYIIQKDSQFLGILITIGYQPKYILRYLACFIGISLLFASVIGVILSLAVIASLGALDGNVLFIPIKDLFYINVWLYPIILGVIALVNFLPILKINNSLDKKNIINSLRLANED